MGDEPATKHDLEDLEKRQLGDMSAMEARIRADLTIQLTDVARRLRADLNRDIGEAISHAVKVTVEQIGAKVTVIDEKYAALPGEVAALRNEISEHTGDSSIHVPPSPRPARRAAKPKRPARKRRK